MHVDYLLPKEKPKASIIFLHGLGFSGRSLIPLARSLALEQPVRMIFPSAPKRRVQAQRNNIPTRAWFNISSWDLATAQVTGLFESISAIESLIAKEAEHGIPEERIVLVGFSQGGSLALALGFSHEVAGVAALSAFLPKHAGFRGKPRMRLAFMTRGEKDPLVPLAFSRDTAMWLEEKGVLVTWRAYPTGHEVGSKEAQDLGQWLRAVLGS